MNIFLSAIMIGIPLIMAIRGAWKGFLRSIFGLVAVVVALIAVAIFSPHVTGALENYTGIDESIENAVSGNLTGMLMGGSESDTSSVQDESYEINGVTYSTDAIRQLLDTDESTLLQSGITQEQITEGQRSAVENSSLPNAIKDALINNDTSAIYDSLGVDTYKDYVVSYITHIIVSAIGVVITFIIVFIVIRLVLKLFGAANNVPVVGTLNRIAGFFLGIALGLVTVSVVCYFITILSPTNLGVSMMAAIGESPILTFIYDIAAWLGDIVRVTVLGQ